MKEFNVQQLKKAAQTLREDILTMIYKAKSGHPGGSLSAADMMAYLYGCRMEIDPKNPGKANRDRFVLSKGHCGPAQYAALAEAGYFEKDVLWSLRDIGSILQGHPDKNKTPGIDVTTGSLGQGLSLGVGLGLAARCNKQNYFTYVMIGDGELQEGQNWEGAMAAAHFKLDHLVVIIDDNGIQCDGITDEVMEVNPIAQKFESFGFDAVEIDASDFVDIHNAFMGFDYNNQKPKCIVMSSIKGKGVSFMENQVCWHGGAPNEEQYSKAMAEIKGGNHA